VPPDVHARVAIEQASTFGWERYIRTSGHIIGMNTFGASALKELQRKFGFHPGGSDGRRKESAEQEVNVSPNFIVTGITVTVLTTGGELFGRRSVWPIKSLLRSMAPAFRSW
jgi:hypothetical protein